jgi:hypothetical protein
MSTPQPSAASEPTRTEKASYEPPRVELVELHPEERLLACLKTFAPVPDCYGDESLS